MTNTIHSLYLLLESVQRRRPTWEELTDQAHDLVSEAEQRALVQREAGQDEHERRVVYYVLTARGAAVLEALSL
jgi:hypothetical protein